MRSSHGVRYMWRSIVDSFGVPAIHMDVVVDPVERIDNFDIPLLAVPHVRPPPVARRVPRTTRGCDRPMHTMKCNPDWRTLAHLHCGLQHRPKSPKSDRGCSRGLQPAFV